ncbi:MAG: dihydroxyacetone kinase subunit L, partial [Mesorhizobium sp.]
MTSIDTAGLKTMFDAIAVAIEADKDRLCQLDGVIGDADHGIAMGLGFGAVRDALASLDLAATEPTALL